MEKELVTFEQALALKELGFDDECIFVNLIENGKFAGIYTPTDYNDFPEQREIEINVPLKQQVFRWFREKYNYDISVRGASFRANWVIGVPLLINNDSKDGYPLVISWDYKTSDGMKVLTYEEAENACIDKLIQIAKK